MTLGSERVQNQRDGDTFNKTFFSDKYECGMELNILRRKLS